MSKRQKAWARVARQRLMMLLGNSCALCGRPDTLTFDCIVPQGDNHHRMDTSARMSFYHRQHQVGNVQLLCELCQSIKSTDDILALRLRTATTRAPCPEQGHHDDAPF
jgi:hypothetical protein